MTGIVDFHRCDVLAEPMTYARYLRLPQLLELQPGPGGLHDHDELLFVIMHQVAELHMKLMLHDLTHAACCLARDDMASVMTALDRVRLIQHEMLHQWELLDTLSVEAFLRFRDCLGSASGFQSAQFRAIEFAFGVKRKSLITACADSAETEKHLLAALRTPSLYDELLMHLHRTGFDVPRDLIDREWSVPLTKRDDLAPLFSHVFEYAPRPTLEVCDGFLALSDGVQRWRTHHVLAAERLIGGRPGTGGTSGVAYLRKALARPIFPELVAAWQGFEARAESTTEADAGGGRTSHEVGHDGIR